VTPQRRWQPPDPVVGPGDPPRRDDPTPLSGVLDRLLGGLGAPPADALTTLFERWSELAGTPLGDHGRPVSVEAGVLIVAVDDALWATEWRYRQGEVLRRCDEALGAGVVTRVDVRVGWPRRGPA
jgi:predicted nucleic acid-binding Zn ribbon protein